jgi:hypothetical protein
MGASKFTVALWLGACVSDIALAAAIFVVARGGLGLGALVLIWLAIRAFKQVGGFNNWRPSRIRQYFIAAKRMGL